MKVCRTCGIDKPLTDYHKNTGRKDGIQSRCKACQKHYHRQHYLRNKETVRKQLQINKQRYREETIDFLLSYFSTHPCIDCGETNPLVLEFDHVRGTKAHNMAELFSGKRKTALIEAELSKCDVRCANCHRIRTAKQRNWYMYQKLTSVQ